MTDPPPTQQRYQTAIAQLTAAIAQSKPDGILLPLILEALAARDEIQTLLQETKGVTGETLTAIADLDQQLKDQAATIDRCLKSIDWQTSFSPSEKAWWWSLKLQKPNPWWNQDWVWQAVSITCITISVGLFGDVSARFLKGGPDTFGAIAVSAQSIGALLTAGGALTIAGQEANKRLLNRFQISEQYWHEVGAGFSVLLLTGAVGLRLSLPQIATLYSDWGFKNYKQGNLGTAEELYKRALQLNPDYEQTHLRLGLLYEDLQDPEQARTSYQLAVRAGIPDAINNLARLKILDKKPEVATSLLLKALEEEEKLSPEERYAMLKNLGWARFQQNDYSDAESTLNDAIALQKSAKLAEKAADPNDDTTLAIASPYCLLAQVKEAQAKKKAALASWDTCNANANFFITEENAWAITARKKLKEEDKRK
ncbi:tetratricopeptide repeat protein [Phormidesmis priestleyi ULC007]|uniref:Tetratricopeptide repeat protein n=1 Tax=Phormidesmis priestleyi ULC007 TaxID=1920490 RepID=A0A2T1D5R1_9CYAN|nr:tetratricopeptide repeat protein [Phormidesmis priestleyi]PSB15843.1 tetratricopeptide repeat protein [Phormidesmis priestleyi ULC007]PZO46117.1 MAG: tetratricopeptide repeat protein [Phormidesmis priestleyi]